MDLSCFNGGNYCRKLRACFFHHCAQHLTTTTIIITTTTIIITTTTIIIIIITTTCATIIIIVSIYLISTCFILQKYVDPRNPENAKSDVRNLLTDMDDDEDMCLSWSEIEHHKEMFVQSKIVNVRRILHDEF